MMCVAVVLHIVAFHKHVWSVLPQPAVVVVGILMQPVRFSYHIEDTSRNRCLTDLMRTPRVIFLGSGTHKTLLEDG